MQRRAYPKIKMEVTWPACLAWAKFAPLCHIVWSFSTKPILSQGKKCSGFAKNPKIVGTSHMYGPLLALRPSTIKNIYPIIMYSPFYEQKMCQVLFKRIANRSPLDLACNIGQGAGLDVMMQTWWRYHVNCEGTTKTVDYKLKKALCSGVLGHTHIWRPHWERGWDQGGQKCPKIAHDQYRWVG